MARGLALAAVLGAACGGRVSGGADGGSISADPSRLPRGLHGAYFRHHGQLALERVDPVIQFGWADAEPGPEIGADNFSVRWTGYLEVPAAGSYTFATV